MEYNIMYESFGRPEKYNSAARSIMSARLAFSERCTTGVPLGAACPDKYLRRHFDFLKVI